MNYKEIISKVNTRYVLVKLESADYQIYDKLQGTMVVIDDPIVNFKELIKELLRRSSKIFKNLSDLPLPIEKPIDWRSNAEERFKTILIKRIHDSNNQEIGAILIGSFNKEITTLKEKKHIEKRLEEYAFNNLYPNEGVNIYSEIYRDIASIIVINNINNLPNEFKKVIW